MVFSNKRLMQRWKTHLKVRRFLSNKFDLEILIPQKTFIILLMNQFYSSLIENNSTPVSRQDDLHIKAMIST